MRGRAAECTGFENQRGASHRGFESSRLRQSAFRGGGTFLSIAAVPISILALSVPGISQTTWFVDQGGGGDFTGIQEAIDSSSVLDGDTVTVRPGTYVDESDDQCYRKQ